MQTDQLLAGVVILSLFGLAVGKLINVLEDSLMRRAELREPQHQALIDSSVRLVARGAQERADRVRAVMTVGD